MIPSAAVIAGPGGSIALGAGIRRAREYEGPFLRLQLAQSFVSRANVLHAEDIVDGAMIEAGAIVETVDGLERHGLVGAQEERGFIHIIPETCRPHADEVFVEPAPPFARTRQSKIGENAVAGPHGTNVNRSIGILHEDIV